MTNLRKKGAIRSEKLLEIIHTNICGPFPIDTHDEKSKALDMVKVYKAEVEKQLDSKIKVVRCDRGGEFYGKFTEKGRSLGPFAIFLQQEGIVA
ncbi:unnamed protein product [Prunus armeniaca]